MTMTVEGQMQDVFARQRAVFRENGAPSVALRKDRLQRAIVMMVENQDRIVEALRADFGCRSAVNSKAADVLSCLMSLKYALFNIDDWVKPEPRELIPGTAGPGARAEVHYQPLGVVGVVSPWNAPFLLSVSPLAGIFAAGNSAMVKPSELTPASSGLLRDMVATHFDEIELAVFPGGQEEGEAFSHIPFDHLMFTGSLATAKKVMMAAAKNLVPVTLELGGKSPVILGKGADLAVAARRIIHGKLMNAGQICISPDYALLPRKLVEPFVAAACAAALGLYSSIEDNEDYTSIISDRHYTRLIHLIDDARAKGATVTVVTPEGQGQSANGRKLPLHILTNVADDMLVMQEEVFGPILSLIPYDRLDDAICHVNDRPRPLALYYFGESPGEREEILRRTWSGNVAVNDVVAQGLREEIPYGGIGASGTGVYKGKDGFRNFSHARPVFYQTADENALAPLRPPFSEGTLYFINSLLTQ